MNLTLSTEQVICHGSLEKQLHSNHRYTLSYQRIFAEQSSQIVLEASDLSASAEFARNHGRSGTKVCSR